MLNFIITKYNPENRNSAGSYMLDEWTCPSEIGKFFNEVKFTQAEYFDIEAKYVSAIIEFLQAESIDHLRVVDLENTYTEKYLSEKDNQWLVSQDFHAMTMHEDKELDHSQVKTVIQMILRNFIWCRLELNEKFGVCFGYDYYMHICCLKSNNEVFEKINNNGLFVEKSGRLYDMKTCDFYIQTCCENEDGISMVEKETLLESMTRKKIKIGLGLSKEHTGNHSFNITEKNHIIFKSDFDFDFSKYEYSLYCDNKLFDY